MKVETDVETEITPVQVTQEFRARELHFCVCYPRKAAGRTSSCGHTVDMLFVTHVTGRAPMVAGQCESHCPPPPAVAATFRVGEGAVVTCENATGLW